MNVESEILTWGSREGVREFTEQGKVHIPLREVVRQKHMKHNWEIENIEGAKITLELEWLSILEGA